MQNPERAQLRLSSILVVSQIDARFFVTLGNPTGVN